MKMNKFNMFITAVCVLFLIKLRWPKNKSIRLICSLYFNTYVTHTVSLGYLWFNEKIGSLSNNVISKYKFTLL